MVQMMKIVCAKFRCSKRTRGDVKRQIVSVRNMTLDGDHLRGQI